jgi:hypothetical protein
VLLLPQREKARASPHGEPRERDGVTAIPARDELRSCGYNTSTRFLRFRGLLQVTHGLKRFPLAKCGLDG